MSKWENLSVKAYWDGESFILKFDNIKDNPLEQVLISTLTTLNGGALSPSNIEGIVPTEKSVDAEKIDGQLDSIVERADTSDLMNLAKPILENYSRYYFDICDINGDFLFDIKNRKDAIARFKDILTKNDCCFVLDNESGQFYTPNYSDAVVIQEKLGYRFLRQI